MKKTITIDEEAWKELRNWQTDNGGTFSANIVGLVREARRNRK